MAIETTILFPPNIFPLVIWYKIIMERKAPFVKLQISKEDSIFLVNVYASQTSKDRANLWKAISNLDIDPNH
jgi:hypothetical protein